MAGRSITLACEDLEVELWPSVGGAVGRFDCGTRPVLRRCQAPLDEVLDAACFPLVPFVNRIRDDCFQFQDRQVRLTPNMAGDPSPLHGQGWTSPWRVEASDGESATLLFEHAPGEWPWAYEARQQVRLFPDALSIELWCRNLSDEPMPCGLGQHPYFHCAPETRLDTFVEHAWTIDEKVLPVEKVPATGRFDLCDRAVCGQDLDHGFDGWSGRARMRDPDWPFEIELSSQAARFFQLYSPPSGGIFVAEPVSHANAALNEPEWRWAALGIRILEPGEAMTLDMRIEVQPT